MRYVRYAGSRLGSGTLAAHAEHRLMLLGSPPDMVHGSTLRKTGSSTLLTGVRRHIAHPRSGIRPCYSGLQVKGTAGSPTSAALSKATLVFYYTRKELSTGRFVNDFFLFTKDGFVCIILKHSKIPYGPVAQLGARSVRIREVEGSNPFRSTKRNGHPSGWRGRIPSGPPKEMVIRQDGHFFWNSREKGFERRLLAACRWHAATAVDPSRSEGESLQVHQKN
jgi:hypothetical protein